MLTKNSYVENIKNIKTNFSIMLKGGLDILLADMRKYPSFNPKAPYAEKNYYFNRANAIGLLLLEVGLYHFTELYFQGTLKAIKEHEKRNNKVFNKGMVYGNLGIAKIAQGEYDKGIAYLILGFEEDAPITGDYEQLFLDSRLYLQFEKKIHEYIKTKRQNYNGFPIPQNYGHDFMKAFDKDNRLYLMAVLNNLRINKEIYSNGNKNKYTAGRLLSTLSDLCVFIEDAIKRKMASATTITLRNLLLNHTLHSETWKIDIEHNWNLASSADMGGLEGNLGRIFAISNDNVKRFLTLGAIRNFSGHNFNVNGPFFYANLDNIENNIFEAMFYLKDRSKL